MSDDVEDLVAEARSLAEAAGALTLRWFNDRYLDIEHKADGSEVTAADRAAERHIREYLATHHGADAILGEEEGIQEGTTGRRWIIDPIDGTRGFVRGVPLYSTLIAVVDDDGPIVGVIHLPALGQTLAAGRGIGCWLGNHRCQVSSVGSLSEAMVTTSGFDAFREDQLVSALARAGHLRTWGDAYGYFLVATGQAEVMVDPICSTWDLAPMPVIITEAGGEFTDLDGRHDYTNGNGLASNGVLHTAALEMLRGSNQ